MADKGLAVTLGELGHQRWRRLDFVGPRYNINTMEDFTIEHIVEEIQKIGRRNHKNLDYELDHVRDELQETIQDREDNYVQRSAWEDSGMSYHDFI